MRTRVLLFAATLVLIASALYAHDLFIKLDSYFLKPDSVIRVPILNGTFMLSESSVTADRVADISVVSPDGISHPGTEAWDAAADTTYLTLQIGRAGTYVLGVSTRPRSIELDAESFNSYLQIEGNPDMLEVRRATGKLDSDAVERYSKHVKAVFQVGDARTTAWNQVLGYPAEVVPLTNPYELAVGEELAVRLLVRGEPVANQMAIVGGERDGGAVEERVARTDENGVVRLVVDGAGKWYVKFIHMVETEEEGVDYESNWATLTFEIK